MCKKIDVEVVRSQLIAWMADNGKSQAEVSKSMGISASALSMFIKGTYTGDNEQIGRKAAALMDLVHRQSAVAKTPGFVETSIAEEIITVANYAQNHCDIGVVCGECRDQKRATRCQPEVERLPRRGGKPETIYRHPAPPAIAWRTNPRPVSGSIFTARHASVTRPA